MKNLIKLILVPFLLASGLFILIRPISAQLGGREERLSDYLLSEKLEVGVETLNDRSHVYYSFEDEKIFITSDSYNNRQPSANGEYITFVKEVRGEGQIYLFHVPSNKTIEITKVGPNLNPNVSRQGKVVWEGWTYNDDGSGTWQIFVFDGTNIKRITQGDISLNPSIDGDHILYARKNILGEWRSEVYSLPADSAKVVSFGQQNKGVELLGDNITFLDGGVYPLKPEDLFLFGIDAMDEQIISTGAGEVEALEIELTEELVPLASPSATPSLAE